MSTYRFWADSILSDAQDEVKGPAAGDADLDSSLECSERCRPAPHVRLHPGHTILALEGEAAWWAGHTCYRSGQVRLGKVS